MTARSAAWRHVCEWPSDFALGDAAVGKRSPGDVAGGAGAASPWLVWADAARRMAGGDYRSAFGQLEALTLPTTTGDRFGTADTELLGLAHATLASGLRQLGQHADAIPHDERALVAGGVATLDGLVGRAADEVGRGDAPSALRWLEAARRHLDSLSSPQGESRFQGESGAQGESGDDDSRGDSGDDRLVLRGATRIAWVEAETALLADEPALPAAERALSAAERLESPRHVLKSRLIRAVSMLQAGRSAGPGPEEDGLRELGAVLDEAAGTRLNTLVWPAALALGPELTSQRRAAAAHAVQFIAARLPSGVGAGWRDSVAPILSM